MYKNVLDFNGGENKKIVIGRCSEECLMKSLSENMSNRNKAKVIVEYAIGVNNEIKLFNANRPFDFYEIKPREIDEIAIEKAIELDINIKDVIDILCEKNIYNNYVDIFVYTYKQYAYMLAEYIDKLYNEYQANIQSIKERLSLLENQRTLVYKQYTAILNNIKVRGLVGEHINEKNILSLFESDFPNSNDLNVAINKLYSLHITHESLDIETAHLQLQLKNSPKPSIIFNNEIIALDSDDSCNKLKTVIRKHLKDNQKKFELYSNVLK